MVLFSLNNWAWRLTATPLWCLSIGRVFNTIANLLHILAKAFNGIAAREHSDTEQGCYKHHQRFFHYVFLQID